VRTIDRLSLRYSALSIFLSVAIFQGILIAPSAGYAQNGAPAAQESGQPSPHMRKKTELPEGDGKAIAEKSCQACHELSNITHASKSLDDWRDTVRIMLDNGADVPADKVDTLIQYLAKNFGPKSDAPPTGGQTAAGSATAKPGELPDGDGKEIATNSCQSCHKLTNLTSAHKNLQEWRDTVQLMMDRGAEIAPDNVEILVNYLAKNFGPKDAAPGGGAPSSSPAAQPH
jgi:cytochrome c5